jgi:hypothetical protein
MAKNNKYQDLAPDDLKGHFMLAEPHEEFIVGIDFCYCEVDYKGFEIVSCKNLGALIYGLEIDEEIATRNMPKHWEETFSIRELKGSFKIHSSDPSDVDAMRGLFGESVGEVSYFEAVWQKFREYWQDYCETDVNILDAKVILEHADEYIFDTTCIEKFITIEAVELFSKHEGGLALGLTEMSDAVAESLSKHQGDLLELRGLTELSDAAAESLSKHQGDLFLDGLTELSDAAAESLSKHQGVLFLDGLTELSDAAAESLSKHQEPLWLRGLTELSDAAAEALSAKFGKICDKDPSEWVAGLRS